MERRAAGAGAVELDGATMVAGAVSEVGAVAPWLTLDIPGPAVPKERPRLGRGGHTYTPERTRQWEAWVALSAAAKYNLPAPDKTAEYAVEMRFYLKSRRRIDGDNLCKSLLDSLNKVVWCDDSQVTEVHYIVYRGASEDRTLVGIYRQCLSGAPQSKSDGEKDVSHV